MTKALIVIFHNNSFNQSPLWRILWGYFKKELLYWKGTFDKLYLVDNNFHFNAEDRRFLDKNGFNYRIDKFNTSVDEALNKVFKLVEEDNFLLIHSDTFIYRKEFIKDNFEMLKETNAVVILDNSGKKISDKFPILKENENRSERARFCNYLWFGRTEDMRKVELKFEPFGEYTDCASYVTEQLLSLPNFKFIELRDDRSNIILEGKEINKFQWLEGGGKLWGQGFPLDLGYYHVRNFSNGFFLINELVNLKESYDRWKAAMPLSEILRILVWEKAIADASEQELNVEDVLRDLGVNQEIWTNYLEEFHNFYKWIKNGN